MLSKTLSFYQKSARYRLEHNFNRVYRFMEVFFEGGHSPYVQFIRKNLTFLSSVIDSGDWDKLRRHPPCVIPDPTGEARLVELALERVRQWSSAQRAAEGAERPRDSEPATP